MVHHNITSLVWNMFDDVKHFNEAFGHCDSVLFAFASTMPSYMESPKDLVLAIFFFWSICFPIAALSVSVSTVMPMTQFTLLPALLQSCQSHITCLQWHKRLDTLQCSQTKFCLNNSTELLRWHGCYFNKVWPHNNIPRTLVMLLMATS